MVVELSFFQTLIFPTSASQVEWKYEEISIKKVKMANLNEIHFLITCGLAKVWQKIWFPGRSADQII